MAKPRSTTSPPSSDELHHRPGFLLRRAHQISVALFLEEVVGLGLTTTRYGVLVALRSSGGLSQASLGQLIGIDRSTSALVVCKLETFGYVARNDDPGDSRSKIVTLTDRGRTILERAAEPAQRARERALEMFSVAEAAKFLGLLERFVDAFNEQTRAPIHASIKDKWLTRS